MINGIIYMVCASFLLGMGPTANQYVLLHGMSSSSVVFFTYLTVSLGSALIIILTKRSFRVRPAQLFMLLIVGAIGMGGTGFLLNLSYSFISVGLATMLHFLYPSLVVIIMIVAFRQKMTFLKGLAIAASIAGMLLISNASGSGRTVGILLALCSSCTYSFYIIANDKGSINELPLVVKLFYTSASACLLFGLISTREFTLPTGPDVCAVLFLISGCGSLAAFFLLTAGIQKTGASIASFLNMLEPITSMLVSSIVYSDLPSQRTILGCIIVLSSVLLVALDGLKTSDA